MLTWTYNTQRATKWRNFDRFSYEMTSECKVQNPHYRDVILKAYTSA